MNDRAAAEVVTLFLCGDVMTGRGVDHVLAHPSDPRLREPYVKDAGEYVALAEAANGPVPRPAPDAYIWGEALAELDRRQPAARIANLETSVTRSSDYWPGKGIHYRMHPDNVGCLTAARFDVCVLANNHVLDFGFAGLHETLDVLEKTGIRTAGAGRDLAAAQAPAVLPLDSRLRLLVFAFGASSSGIPAEWAAGAHRAGVDLVSDLSKSTAARIGDHVHRRKQARDLAIASIHWGDNWGYDVPEEHRRFAHWLVDAGIDLVHGHSSHHPRPLEVYRDHLILYGCGDLLNDYEGISGYEEYRDDLGLLYFPTLSAAGALVELTMVPMQTCALRLRQASGPDRRWLQERLARACEPFGTRLELAGDGTIGVQLR